MSISATGPFRMEIPGAPCAAGGFALSIALSTLSEMMPLDLRAWPEVNAVSERHHFDYEVRYKSEATRHLEWSISLFSPEPSSYSNKSELQELHTIGDAVSLVSFSQGPVII